MTRWSELHIPTLREDPADATAESHRLLVRGGFIRQLTAGHYTLLPLAVRVRERIIGIIREELGRIGAQEFLLPALQPAEIWKRSGRWDLIGAELFRLRDRKDTDLVLALSNEEAIVTLLRELRSYRRFPQSWYQFQAKFRDEPRPKAGLLRGREFVMKDCYSFDLDEAGLDRSFERHNEAYQKIFERLRMPMMPVREHVDGVLGARSVEWVCPTAAGEDDVARCDSCGYTAHAAEAVSVAAPVTDEAGAGAPEKSTESTASAASDRHINTLVYVIDGEPTAVLLRGDQELAENKLAAAAKATELRPAHRDEIRYALGIASPAHLGAVGVRLPVIADESLRGRRAMTTGANIDGTFLHGVDIGRDIAVGQWADLRKAANGELCLRCGGVLRVHRTILIGHVYKHGDTFAKKFGAEIAGPEGELVAPLMASYGIGIERTLGTIVEVNHDDAGIVWPVSVAPFEAAVTVLNTGDEGTRAVGEKIYDRLSGSGVDVIIDDRNERPGVKFRDAELIGIPFRITVSTRGLRDGEVELTRRSTGETIRVAADAAADRLTGLLTAERG